MAIHFRKTLSLACIFHHFSVLDNIYQVDCPMLVMLMWLFQHIFQFQLLHLFPYGLTTRASVWWPGVSRAVENFVKHQCSECAKVAPVRREPLMTTPLPKCPWQVVGSDLFEINSEHYLIVVDYNSRYPEVIRLSTTTSSQENLHNHSI